MSNGAVVAAVAAARRKARERVLRAFREAGATSAQHAQPMRDQLSDRRARSELARLSDAGVIRQPAPGRFYLDETALADYNANRRRVALILLSVVLLALTIMMAVLGSR